MARRRTRPRSNAERGRAGRARLKLEAGELGKRDTAWLAHYDRDVTSHRRARAAAPRAPKGVRARTNTERGKASRLRHEPKLSKRDEKWLERYDAAVDKGQRTRALRRARTRKRSAGADARAISRALGDWMGGTDEVRATKAGRRTGGASAEATIGDFLEPKGRPELGGHLSKGHAMSIRVELLLPKGGSRWVTVLAYTDRAEVAEVDLWIEIFEAMEAYKADAVGAVAVIVGDA